MTADQLIIHWIKRSLEWKQPFEFSSVELQSNCVDYGYKLEVYHTPDLYSRRWRKLREMYKINATYNIPFAIKEFEKKGSRVKWYRITKK